MMDMSVILRVAVVPQLCTYVNTHQTAHFKYAQFVVCHLYVNRAAKNKVFLLLSQTTYCICVPLVIFLPISSKILCHFLS